MYRYNVEFHAEPVRWSGTIQLYMRQNLPSGYAYGVDVIMQEFDAEGDEAIVEAEPLMGFDAAAAQQLMDELWKCGLRPSEGTGSAGQLASVQYHLEDMRKLVFDEQD